MTVKQSSLGFSDTVARISDAVTAAGSRIFATIDQAKAAADSGLSLRPTTLLIFGNPKGGTPFMDAFPLVGLDLPLKILVWEDQNGVSVAYVPMSEIATRFSVKGFDAQIAAMDRAMDSVTSV